MKDVVQSLGDFPSRIVSLHFRQVAVVADMIADAVLIHIAPIHEVAGDLLSSSKSFENRAGVALAATQVVHLRHARRLPELEHEARHIFGVDIISHLFSLVAVNLIFPAFDVTLDEITQKAMQLDAGVIRPGEASPAQTTGGHIEVAAVFLNHDVGGDFGRAKQGMLALIDRKAFRYSIRKGRIVVLKAGFQLFQGDLVRPVPVDFIGGHVNERGFRTRSPGRFQHMQGSQSVYLEVEERNGSCAVVGWLSCGMDDQIRPQFVDEGEQLIPFPDVQRKMLVARDFAPQPLQYPTGITLRPEKDGAMIAVDSMNLETVAREEARDFGADQSAGSGNEDGWHG